MLFCPRRIGKYQLPVYLFSKLHYSECFSDIPFIPISLKKAQSVSSSASFKEYQLYKPLLYFSEFSHYLH